MPNRKQLADTRQPMTLADADALLKDLAILNNRVATREKQAQERIDKIKTDLDAANRGDAAAIETREQRLCRFIDANPQHFKRPKMRKTKYGKYGVTTTTQTEVDNDDATLKYVRDQALKSAYKTEHKLLKPGLKALLKNGVKIPGCRLSVGTVSKYVVNADLAKTKDDLDLDAIPAQEPV